jgi:hypothetical protein
MVRKPVSYSLDEKAVALIDDFAKFLGISRTRLVEDSVRTVAFIHSLAARQHNATWEEVRRRYRGSAQVTIKVVLDENGKERGRILIDGKEPEDVSAEIVLEERADGSGLTHVFIDVKDWDRAEFGTVRVGPTVMLTQPLLAHARLPYPVDPTIGLVATLDELVALPHVGELTRVGEVEEPVEA